MKSIVGKIYIFYLYHFPINRGKNLLGRILTKIFSTFRLTTRENVILEIFLSSSMDTSYFAKNFYQNNILIDEIFKLKPNQNFLDVGANIGYYSILASKIVGRNGRVYSFEPSLREFFRLIKNIDLNKCTNIIPLNIALSDSNNELSFSIAEGHTGLNSMKIYDNSVRKRIQLTRTIRLDNLFCSENIKFHIVKIDVEGAELLVLKGMEDLLKSKNIDKIIIEITPRFFNLFNYSKKDIYEYLEQFGYQPTINCNSEQYDELFVLDN